MFEEYKYYEEQLNSMKIEAENCIKLNDRYNDIANETDKLIVDTKTKQTENQNESLKEIETIEKNISSIDDQLTKIDNQILEKQNDNDSINQSLGDTLPQSDCTIYEETIKQLNSFDVRSYCRNQNSERIKDGTEFYNTAYESCVKSKNDEINKDTQTYNQLLELCVSNNRLNIQLEEAKRQNNLVQIDVLEKQINENNQKINTLTNETNSVVSTNENLQSSKLQQNNKVGVIDTTAKILGKNPDQITDSSGVIKLTESEKVSLKIKEEQNKSEINKLNRTKELLNQQKAEQEVSKEKIEKEYTETQTQYNEDIGVYQKIKQSNTYIGYNIPDKGTPFKANCCEEFLKSILKNLELVQGSLQEIEKRTINCYDDWYKIMYESLNKYNSNSGGNYIDYIDDLKLNFKLFVDNRGIQNLPYTSSVNPIWEWNPTQEFSGVYFEGTEAQVTEVEQSIIQSIVNSGSKPSETIFEPEWQTLNFSLPECVCKDLRRLYPDKRFKFGIEIENFECAVCLVVDNIKVNVTDCNTVRRLSFNDCMIPELSCVIDNKKSWVYFEDGVKEEVKYPDGECNVNSENNYTVTKLVGPQERLWKELEYRYTEYDINHSDLLLNTKSATFAIDPANAIECDVYNFWKNIDCDECPTSCVSGETVVYSDSVISGDTLIPYSLPLTGGTTTNILNLDGGDAIIYLDSRTGVYSNAGTIPANLGDDVYQWDDISLYNNNAIQTVAGDRPTYISGGTCFGEQNVLYFDRGENDFMSVTNDSSFDSLTGLTLFMYFTKNDSQSWGVNDVVTQYSDSDAIFDGWGVDVQQYFGESYLRFVYNDPADPPSGYNFLEIRTPFLDNSGPNECTLYTFRVGGSDGTQPTTIEGWTGTSLESYSIGTGNGITYAPTTEPLSIGGSATSSLPSPVNFATYILYNGALTDEAIAEVQNYIISNIGSGSTSSEFNCETYTTILNEQVTELKNDYYTLTADYNGTLNASYKDLLEKGGSLSEFKILDNNCNTNNIVIGNDSELNNLFGTLVEEADGTLSFWEIYVYDSSTPYSNGAITDIGNGLSAQTFNQTSSFDSECCSSINSLITSKGVNGLGVDKNYVWNDTLSKCTWMEIDNCEGDCSYSGTKKVISREDCLSGITTGTTVDVCINPLDYLDFDPSTINVKEVFDELVVSNLIDAKSRQVISSYPTLKLFYLLYLNATNCGKDLSGKLTYNSLFEFMDKIGDYWLDLLEQVVPATTIWEGCDNSGKIYRNTVFDQNKYAYRRYVLNFNDSEICPLSGITNDSIGSAMVYAEVNEKLLTPDNPEIRKIKQEIKYITNEIYVIKEDIEKLECRLEALLLIENPTKEQQNEIAEKKEELAYLNKLLNDIEEKLKKLNEELIKLEQKFIENQNNFDETVEGCQKFSEQITIAKQNLEDQYTVGTLEYERQRNYIAGLENQYRKCVKQKQTQISYYDTVFITHINDSNEYEGNVTVIGDPEWEKGGYFYQSELIHNCEKIYKAYYE